MFYLSGGGISRNAKSDTEDEFGWYLGAHEEIEDRIYSDSRRFVRSSKLNCMNGEKTSTEAKSSLCSTNSCTESEDPEESYVAAEDFITKAENSVVDSATMDRIEMESFECADDIELDLVTMEKNTDRVFASSMRSVTDRGNSLKIENESEDEDPPVSCYTPERLVRCQEYRILTHSPNFFAIPRSTPNGIDDTGLRRYRGYRRRLGDLKYSFLNTGESHLEVFLDPAAPEVRSPLTNRRRPNFRDRVPNKKNMEKDIKVDSREALATAKRETPVAFQSLDIVSDRSSYERLNNSWKIDESAKIVRRSSQDTSGIHSNDWSTNTPSDIRTAVCLCDELATASRNFGNFMESSNRATAINEVVSILENLEKDPNRATVLLEEDRFCEATSGHERLTRLALSIEPDGAIPKVTRDAKSLFFELRDKVERLEETSRDIFKDIDRLRADFEYNENKVDDLIDGTVTLRQNMNEMRYLDDLLNLLDGELERISRRNWPFVFGHSEYRAEDMNLVV